MIAVALLALVLLGVAVGFAAVAASATRVRTAENLDQIEAYGYAGRGSSPAGDESATRKTFDSLAAAIGDFLGERMSRLREDELQRRLVAAGVFTLGPRRFLGYRVLLTLALAIVPAWLATLASAPAALAVLLVPLGAAAGWLGPDLALRRRARRRLQQIDDDLPELIDLLVVTVEAGVGFTASLRLAAERLRGPLGDELRLTIQEQNLGLSTLESLENWNARCDMPAVRSFVRAMVQGERLGVSIGQILRNLALEQRKRRRQRAEERAQKAPVKILFPLVFLIFPALFVVILGPTLYRIADAFAGR